MAFNRRVTRNIGITPVEVYSGPVNAATLIGFTLCNIAATTIQVSVYTVVSGLSYNILKDSTIIPGQTLVIVGGDQKDCVLENDSIFVVSNTADSVDVKVSALEGVNE